MALIHNNEKSRLDKIRPSIASLVKKLSNDFEVVSEEINHQPEIKPVARGLGFFRDITYWKLYREWAKYREVRKPFLPFHFIKLVIKSIRKYSSQKISKNWLKTCSIEMAVSDKHLRAISNAIENDSDYLLVFEDDVIFRENSILNFYKFFTKLNFSNQGLYVDLAGGLDISSLGINKLEIKKDKFFRYYKLPVTNTACCYLINKKQLVTFNNFLTNNPLLRYVGIDWLFNKLFILQRLAGINADCIHSDPSIFKHGSFTGEFEAWER